MSEPLRKSMYRLSTVLWSMAFFGRLADGRIDEAVEYLKRMNPDQVGTLTLISEVLPGLLRDFREKP